jgi:hypothetical protein
MYWGKACFWFCLLFCTFLLIGISCNHSTEVDDKGCEDNTEPYLGKLYYKINDVPTDDLIMYATDQFGIYYEFVDYDCNLGGGIIYLKVDDGDWIAAKPLPTDTPCSYKEADTPVGIDDVLKFAPDLEPGEHAFQTLWTDNCDIRSEIKTGTFVIIEEGDDDDDDAA